MNPKRHTRSFNVTMLILVIVAGSLLATSAAAATQTRQKPPPPTSSGSIVLVDQMWVCNGPVNLDSVTVTITGNVRDRTDAIHLQPGCTGRIGKIQVVQYSADAVKVAQGVHDLTVGSGSISCLAKGPTLHQDGIQVMGGDRITFNNLSINCGRAADTLIDSNFFVNEAGSSTSPPTDVVCNGCTLGGWTAHTVNLQDSVRSGLANSTLCVGRYPKLTMTIGSGAISPVNTGNRIAAC